VVTIIGVTASWELYGKEKMACARQDPEDIEETEIDVEED
jgi:hypothetical protein